MTQAFPAPVTARGPVDVPDGAPIDVAALIDQSPITGFQVGAMVLCALVGLLDGFDTQAIAVAGPAIADSLHVGRAALGPIFATSLFGAMLGALSFGPLADRFGRRRLLLLATLVFGVFTLLTARAPSYPALLATRLLAGIGLGGATPCLLALASEYAPTRRRAALTSLLWAAFPLGAALGAFVNGWILTHADWRTVFVVGGIASFVVWVLLFAWLPESIRFLAADGRRSERLAAIVRRIRPDLPAGVRFAQPARRIEGVPLRLLFTEGRAVGTLLLWVPFFTGFAVLAITVVWTPLLLLRDHGIGLGEASIALGLNSFGSLAGMAAAGWLLEAYGATRVVVPALVLGGAATALLGQVADSAQATWLTITLAGLLVGIGSSGSIALASLRYPTAMRSSGIGWAMGMGRFGQVLAPLAASAMATRGIPGETMFHLFGAAPVLGALAALLMHRAAPRAVGKDATAVV